MDVFASLLDGPRARGAFLLRCVMEPPWSLLVRDEAPLTLVAMREGQGWVVPRTGEPLPLRAGDVAVLRGPEPYSIADAPDSPTQVIVHPGQTCTSPQGECLSDAMDLGVRTWGNCEQGSTVMLIGTYQMRGAVSQRLLAALPALVVHPREAWDSPLLPLLDSEIVKDEPGQEVVLDRLLDLLLVAILRSWFARPEAEAPAWYRALGDPLVGRALRLMHADPARRWTVGMLASETGVSRAVLARRFTELVGDPPMTFLAGWRLAVAADLLREPDLTIGAVAGKVGYGSSFALSAAFKRAHGVSPAQYRLASAGRTR